MMEDIEDIDVELLISLVHNRPVIWDKSLEQYKCRVETKAAWKEVCTHMNPDFEGLSDEAKDKYGKMISTKWTNVRDRYHKYLKKLQEEKKSGFKAKSFKKYVYSDQMSFLLKNGPRKETVSSTEVEIEESGTNEPGIDSPDGHALTNKESNQTVVHPKIPTRGKKKRQRSSITDVENYLLQKLQQPENRHVNFFKSILPTLQKFDDNETLQYQGEVIKIIQNIHRSRLVHGESNIHPSPHCCVSQFGHVEQGNWRRARQPPSSRGGGSFTPAQPRMATTPLSGHTNSYGQSQWNPASQDAPTTTPTPPIVSPALSPSSTHSISSDSDHTVNLDLDFA